MAEPDKANRFPINKETMISFGVALAIGSGCYIAGGYAEKVQRFDRLDAGERLVRIEAKVSLIAQRLGIPADLKVDIRGVSATK